MAPIIPLPTSAQIAPLDPKLYEALQDVSQQATPQPAPTGPMVGYASVKNGVVRFHQAQRDKS